MTKRYSKKPILVTGSHRSGSTWVGRMLAASPEVLYINEPFHIGHDIGICGVHFNYWFTYVCNQNEGKYYHHIKRTINFHYNMLGKLRTAKKLRTILGAIVKYFLFLRYHFINIRPLLKDPLAIFSAEWLASKFDMHVVILIRHPAAFVSGLKMDNWTYDFSHFTKQPLLMKDHLYPFEDKIRKFEEEEQSIVDQAAFLWILIHYMIKKYKEKHPDWVFVRHEDLSRDPLNGFQKLFHRLDLPFTQNIKEIIRWHCFPSDSYYLNNNNRFNSLQRNSAANIWNWKARLTEVEIERIKSQVQDISKEFYSEQEW